MSGDEGMTLCCMMLRLLWRLLVSVLVLAAKDEMVGEGAVVVVDDAATGDDAEDRDLDWELEWMEDSIHESNFTRDEMMVRRD